MDAVQVLNRISLIPVFCCLCLFVNAQGSEDYLHHVISFEGQTEFIQVVESDSNNWQVGPANKVKLDSAYSPVNCIITDTVNFYSKNNVSHFDLQIGFFNYGEEFFLNNFISFKHRFDTDTLCDGGFISLSSDGGQTFTNVIESGALSPPAIPGEEFDSHGLYTAQDTLFTGEPGFSGCASEWKHSWFGWYVQPAFAPGATGGIVDTMLVRFTFISDSIQTNKEGWQIDDIHLYGSYLGGFVGSQERVEFEVYPNPTSTLATIRIPSDFSSIDIQVYNVAGELVTVERSTHSNSFKLNVSQLPRGFYIVRVFGDHEYLGSRQLVIGS